MNKQEEKCPQCPKHCSKNELSCGRGRAYFGVEGGIENRPSHFNMTEDHGVMPLLRQCGHMLHHSSGDINNDILCKGLTEEEKRKLEDLLKRVLNNLKQE
ncbi:MAG: hypothetical protein ACI35W_03390 [Anaeroplasmataceae bacterium]